MDHQAPIMLQLLIILAVFYYNTGDYKLARSFLSSCGIYKKSPEAGSIRQVFVINNFRCIIITIWEITIPLMSLIADAQK